MNWQQSLIGCGRAHTMPAHVGIVACSAEGAALCYRTICAEGRAVSRPHAHPEIPCTHSLAEYVTHLIATTGRASGHSCFPRPTSWPGRCRFPICPDNTIHQALPLIEAQSPLPGCIAEVVASAAARGFRRVGLTGTHWLLNSEIYSSKFNAKNIEVVRPSPEERRDINRIIMDELVRGIFKTEAVARFQQVIGRLRGAGCDAVVLGCTEIPLIINDSNSVLPTLDSPRLLARAALERSLRGARA
jgi:aspartate racemase